MRKLDIIEPNYHEDDALIILERYFDLWSKDEDWWQDNGSVDINAWRDEEDRGLWHIFVRGLVNMSDGTYQTQTSLEIDKFTFNLENK